MQLKPFKNTLLQKIIYYRKVFFLFLIFTIGIWALFPLNNFELFLAQGDHGRDLYAYKKTMEGAVPYQDYRWEYGPLMPYYYSLFFRLFGISIQSVLLGQNILVLLSGVFVFLICSVFLSPFVSFVCALWFLAFRGEFFYTYNHAGAILILLIVIFCLFKYHKELKRAYALAGFAGLLLIFFIRPNIGIVCTISFLFSLILTDYYKNRAVLMKNMRLYLSLALLTIFVAAFIYWVFLHSLPAYYIRQCFHYTRSFHGHSMLMTTIFDSLYSLWRIIKFNFTATLTRKLFGIIFLLSISRLIYLILKNKLDEENKTNTLLSLCFLSFFALLNLHEFLASGYLYRLNWSLPLFIIIIFFCLDKGTEKLFSLTKISLFSALMIIAFLNVSHSHRIIASTKRPENLLSVNATKVYISNQKEWIKTVTGVTKSIVQNIPEDEKILAVPYEPLYYFLANHDSVVRELSFTEYQSMPTIQEELIIQKLKASKVNFIIMSNRAIIDDGKFGHFGRTCCQLLAQYIQNNFKEVATFGDWKRPAGWTENHAVKILRRITRE